MPTKPKRTMSTGDLKAKCQEMGLEWGKFDLSKILQIIQVIIGLLNQNKVGMQAKTECGPGECDHIACSLETLQLALATAESAAYHMQECGPVPPEPSPPA